MERDTNSSRLKKSRVVGVALILIGAILLMVAYLVGWTSSNLVLLAGLALKGLVCCPSTLSVDIALKASKRVRNVFIFGSSNRIDAVSASFADRRKALKFAEFASNASLISEDATTIL